jgi:hypothetical protein
VGEVLARQQVIDKTKSLLRSFAHGNGHCAVKFDNRGWLNPKQPVEEQRNLALVRGCRGKQMLAAYHENQTSGHETLADKPIMRQ